IFYESQTLKLLPFYKNMAEVKEEIIVYNPEKLLIICYCVIVERAQYTLNDLVKIWTTDKRDEKLEYFSPEKLAFYYYQAICSLVLLHSKSMFYSDMKGPNLLVFRTQEVKLGDFGISVKLDPTDKDPNEEKYYGKGLTIGYVTDTYKECFE